jgi:death on curing protein
MHEYYIARFGGTLVLRDLGALESAVIPPQDVYYYRGGDLFDIAAAYAFHIAKAQPFPDTNKRAPVGNSR